MAASTTAEFRPAVFDEGGTFLRLSRHRLGLTARSRPRKHSPRRSRAAREGYAVQGLAANIPAWSSQPDRRRLTEIYISDGIEQLTGTPPATSSTTGPQLRQLIHSRRPRGVASAITQDAVANRRSCLSRISRAAQGRLGAVGSERTQPVYDAAGRPLYIDASSSTSPSARSGGRAGGQPHRIARREASSARCCRTSRAPSIRCSTKSKVAALPERRGRSRVRLYAEEFLAKRAPSFPSLGARDDLVAVERTSAIAVAQRTPFRDRVSHHPAATARSAGSRTADAPLGEDGRFPHSTAAYSTSRAQKGRARSPRARLCAGERRQFRSLTASISRRRLPLQLDDNWTSVFMSDAMVEISGYTVAELGKAERRATATDRSEDRSGLRSDRPRRGRAAAILRIEYRIRRRTAACAGAGCAAAASSATTAGRCSCDDRLRITERKAAEAELLRTRNHAGERTAPSRVSGRDEATSCATP